MPDLADTHVCVADDISGVGEALILNISGGLHSLADGFASFAEFIFAEFFVVHTRDFDMDVDAVEDGTRDSFLVFGDNGRGAGAGFLCVSKMSAWAGVCIIERTCIRRNIAKLDLYSQ